MARLSFTFDARRAAEAASRFTELAGGTIELVRLVKLLYLAERRSIENFRHPMFGDRYMSMEHGPVVSHAYNLLKDDPVAKSAESAGDVRLWERHFDRVGYMVRLQEKLAPAALSRADLKLIEQLHADWLPIGTWDMVEKLHRDLAEWSDPGKTSTPIAVETLCAVLGLQDREVQDLAEQVRAGEAMDLLHD